MAFLLFDLCRGTQGRFDVPHPFGPHVCGGKVVVVVVVVVVVGGSEKSSADILPPVLWSTSILLKQKGKSASSNSKRAVEWLPTNEPVTDTRFPPGAGRSTGPGGDQVPPLKVIVEGAMLGLDCHLSSTSYPGVAEVPR
jgi:hypothetical protein